MAAPGRLPIVVGDRGGQIQVAFDAPAEERGEVWIAAVANARTVAVKGGENASRTLTYTHVVRRLTRLGTFKGGHADIGVAREQVLPPDADRYVVLVQRGAAGLPGAILGAAERIAR